MRYCSRVLCVVAYVCFASTLVVAEEAQKEELTGCKLPHGELVVPDRNTPEAKSGYILRISDGTLNPSPWKAGERPKSTADFLLRITSDRAGDLMYSSLNDGSLGIVSTRVTDLGKKFLYELSSLALDRPQPVQSKEERSGSGEASPGVIDRAQDGHCYLIETADGKFALVRLIQKRDRRALVQYVYQPDGTRAFDIPKGSIASVPVSAIAASAGTSARSGTSSSGISVEKVNIRDFGKAREIHMENRKVMIELGVNLVSSKEASLPARRLAVILLLGQLRAIEGAPVLAARVDENLAMHSSEITVQNSYIGVDALIQIGIQGANAALGQIEADAKSEPPKQGDLADWGNRVELRRNLLALAILGVYGEKLAKIVLENKIAEAAEPRMKDAYQKALEAFPRVKNWLPEEKSVTTMPATTMPTR